MDLTHRNWHQRESNLRPLEEQTPRSQEMVSYEKFFVKMKKGWTQSLSPNNAKKHSKS
ncbi:hypothetical protein MTR_8g067510 [Medicago truncatula]|uniref:Uncharacterized protein n=1 Tax=Medicago truncatula TaxID=3880 RepID=G7LHS9_MEDTR|nr:hypothetical protein MTR_8g067510 [Medicago truncatula]